MCCTQAPETRPGIRIHPVSDGYETKLQSLVLMHYLVDLKHRWKEKERKNESARERERKGTLDASVVYKMSEEALKGTMNFIVVFVVSFSFCLLKFLFFSLQRSRVLLHPKYPAVRWRALCFSGVPALATAAWAATSSHSLQFLPAWVRDPGAVTCLCACVSRSSSPSSFSVLMLAHDPPQHIIHG